MSLINYHLSISPKNVCYFSSQSSCKTYLNAGFYAALSWKYFNMLPASPYLRSLWRFVLKWFLWSRGVYLRLDDPSTRQLANSWAAFSAIPESSAHSISKACTSEIILFHSNRWHASGNWSVWLCSRKRSDIAQLPASRFIERVIRTLQSILVSAVGFLTTLYLLSTAFLPTLKQTYLQEVTFPSNLLLF